MEESPYSFLELKTPKDIVGVTLDNKANHALFQAVVSATSISNAKLAGLFNTEMDVPGIRVNAKSDLMFPLKRLLEDKLIQQLFYLMIQEGEGIVVKSCFIGLPSESKERLGEIYNRVLEVSYKNIASYIENSVKFSSKAFEKELENNLNHNLTLTSVNYPQSIIEPFKAIETFITELPLDKNVITNSKSEIEQALLNANLIGKLDDNLYLIMNEKDLIEKFEIADEIIVNKIYPMYKARVGDEIEKINHAEDLNKAEKYKLPDLDQKKKRAEILHKVISDLQKNQIQYPGSLAILTVLLLEKKVKDLYKKREDGQVQKDYENYIRTIVSQSDEWNSLIHYIDEDKTRNTHPETIDKLKKEKRIAHAHWLIKGKEVLVLASKDKSTFAKTIKSMNNTPPAENWKILAFRELLERNEDSFPDLFKDSNLVKIYGNLLKKAYISYFPWYYPLLIHFSYFLDLFFKKAKETIKGEQEFQKKKKEQNDELLNKKKESEKLKTAAENKKERQLIEIIDILDQICFMQEAIPYFKIVMEKANQSNPALFHEFLKKENFQLIHLKKNSTDDDIVILFPIDPEWRGKESKLKSMLHKKIEDLSLKPGDNKKTLFPYKMIYNQLTRQPGKKDSLVPQASGDTDSIPGSTMTL